MQHVVEDLISLSRIEAEKFSVPDRRCRAGPILDQAIEGARRMADERRSPLVRDLAKNCRDRGRSRPDPASVDHLDQRAALR